MKNRDATIFVLKCMKSLTIHLHGWLSKMSVMNSVCNQYCQSNRLVPYLMWIKISSFSITWISFELCILNFPSWELLTFWNICWGFAWYCLIQILSIVLLTKIFIFIEYFDVQCTNILFPTMLLPLSATFCSWKQYPHNGEDPLSWLYR